MSTVLTPFGGDLPVVLHRPLTLQPAPLTVRYAVAKHVRYAVCADTHPQPGRGGPVGTTALQHHNPHFSVSTGQPDRQYAVEVRPLM
jgi:hypothetical protein